MISIIAAMSKNRVIGNNGSIPWFIKGEQKRAKEITLGHPIIMGRKTHESIGKPLPGRTNIVITSSPGLTSEGIIKVASLAEAISKATEVDTEIFIFGGERVFREALEKNLVDRIYLTIIDREFKGDVFFPMLDLSKWKISSEEEKSLKDLNYKYMIYDRL